MLNQKVLFSSIGEKYSAVKFSLGEKLSATFRDARQHNYAPASFNVFRISKTELVHMYYCYSE